MQKLKRKVEKLKSVNEKLEKELHFNSPRGPIAKTVHRPSKNSKSESGEREVKEKDEKSREKDQDKKIIELASVSTSPRAKSILFAGSYSSSADTTQGSREIDVREIQERLRRRSVSKRILDRLAYFETMRTEVSTSPPTPSLSSRTSLSSSATHIGHVRSDESLATAPSFSSLTDSETTANKNSGSDNNNNKEETNKRRSLLKRSSSLNTRRRLSVHAGKGMSLRDMSSAASTASVSLASSTSNATDTNLASDFGGAISSVNQIFYGKAELVKLLLELDEFD